jgi:hypothetical protein
MIVMGGPERALAEYFTPETFARILEPEAA